MRPRTDPHWVFAKRGPRIGEYAPGPSNIGALALSTVTVCALLMFVNASSVGCGCRCPSLRIRQIGPSNRRAHAGASKIPAFDMLAVEGCVYLVLGDPSRAGCGGEFPRIAHSRNGALEGASFQRPPGLRLHSLAVFDRPTHPPARSVRRSLTSLPIDLLLRSASRRLLAFP